ncbi:hypothetical protein BKK47_11560 [Rodentibacter mrazii]|uniref:Uncharacterized protein n=1 Tax=Rodentibacter mrazii TaxID=1908257 RepID=A0A1V3I8Y6_9PAST|nr:hypothetical protein [Rodentibacter mrazii]OOF36535.1 hypothetical protein BKK47_11560 [Rodentibacter mrazii]
MSNSLFRFFGDFQFRMFSFINIFSATGFCAISLSLALSEKSKPLIEVFLDFLLFYNPAIGLLTLVTYFSGKTKLEILLFCELVVLLALIYLGV